MSAREKILESLMELTDRPQASNRQAVLEKVLRAALPLVDCDAATLLVPLGRSSERWALRGEDVPQAIDVSRSCTEFTRTLMRAGQPITIADVSEDARLGPEDRFPGIADGPALFIPLRSREQTPCYLAVFRVRGRSRFGRDEVRLVTLLAAWAALALENLRLSESVEKLAVTDELTQVYNYRFLKTALRREIKRAGRFGQLLSIVMIDVDNLKIYNDRNGHLRGSFLLKECAQLFAQQIRSFDLVAKYGGDEFTLILPQTDTDGAHVVGERMRAAVAGHTFPLATKGAITVSMGIATFPEDATDSQSLIQAADRALYRAKRNGRNRVERQERHAA